MGTHLCTVMQMVILGKMMITNKYLISEGEYTVIVQPKPVGYWAFGASPAGVGCVQFAVYSKVTDEQIKATEDLLGWKWKEAKK